VLFASWFSACTAVEHPDPVVAELWTDCRRRAASPKVEPKPEVKPQQTRAQDRTEGVRSPTSRSSGKRRRRGGAAAQSIIRSASGAARRSRQALSRSREKQEAVKQFAPPAASVATPLLEKNSRADLSISFRRPTSRGTPEAIFDVVQLPTGEVLSAHLRKSSGNKDYDEGRAGDMEELAGCPARPADHSSGN